VTNAAITLPSHLLLRRLLTRNVLLVLTRLHATAAKGRTGIAASIDGVLDAAQGSLLDAAKAEAFKNRRQVLKSESEQNGVRVEDIYLFRNTELAHSLHAPASARPGLPWYAINPLSIGSYELVRDIETALVANGASVLQPLKPSESKQEEWEAHGRALWCIDLPS
jgi:hypothetical protein